MAPKIKSDPVAAAAAAAFLAERGVTRIGGKARLLSCAFQACSRDNFLPNGSGPWHHTNCPVGTVFFTSISAALKEHGEDSLEHKQALQNAKDYAAKLAEERKAAAAAEAAAAK